MIRSILLMVFPLVCVQAMAQNVRRANSYETGEIRNGYKVGTWEYLDTDGILDLKINYDSGALLYFKPDTSEYQVYIDEKWVLKKLSRQPRYVGSYVEFYRILVSKLRYPATAKENNISSTVFLRFEVSTQGKVENLEVLNDPDRYFTDEIISNFYALPNIWIDGVYEGHSVPSRIILPLHFKVSKDDTSEFDQAASDALPGKKLQAIVISVPE